MLIDCLLTEQTITVPSYVTEIGSYAFAYSNIHTVVLPDSISKIGNHAFYDCNNLESILLPDTLERIGECAFAYSTISMVVIPLATSEIGYGAFLSRETLKTIYCEAAEQPSGWSSGWLYGTNAEVVWGYDGTDESGD